MVSKIECEYWLIKKIIYKTKNQHANTLIYRRLNQLKRLLKKYIEQNQISNIKEICEKVFILATSNIEMEHHVGFSLVIIGICARIYMLIENEESEIIDDIFGCL
ncbi:Ribonuclease MRP protein subunit rmp1 [Dictyocoela muelleri]|nr:Ribonuclease MRP protein subunit rmp1 [Dictyocoela muelleri]